MLLPDHVRCAFDVLVELITAGRISAEELSDIGRIVDEGIVADIASAILPSAQPGSSEAAVAGTLAWLAHVDLTAVLSPHAIARYMIASVEHGSPTPDPPDAWIDLYLGSELHMETAERVQVIAEVLDNISSSAPGLWNFAQGIYSLFEMDKPAMDALRAAVKNQSILMTLDSLSAER